MQLLVRLLGIDPENVRVEALEEVSQKRLKQTQLTSTMGLTVKQNSHTGNTILTSLARLSSYALLPDIYTYCRLTSDLF